MLPVIGIYNGEPVEYAPIFRRKDINLRVPNDDSQYVMILHDSDVLGHPRQFESGQTARYPFPAVVNVKWGLVTSYAGKVYDYVPMHDLWQWWMLEFWNWASGYLLPMGEILGTYTKPNNPRALYTRATPGSLLELYIGMIADAKSHTDSSPPELGARDVVTGRNLTAKKNWEWLCRPCTGQLGRVIADRGTKLELETIDLLKPCPTMDELEAKPWLYGWATQIAIDGTVSRYPDIKNAFAMHGLPPAGTPIPFVSRGGSVLINKKACRVLTPGASWSPYVP